jgi:hypothetical protein
VLFPDGPLTGEFIQHVRGVIHPNGQVTFQGTMTFTGTAQGCGEDPITVTAHLNGKGSAGEHPVTDARFALVVQSPANGNGTVHQDGFALAYDVRYTCR